MEQKDEIREYYENKPRFNGVYSRDNFSKQYKMEHMLYILINMQM